MEHDPQNHGKTKEAGRQEEVMTPSHALYRHIRSFYLLFTLRSAAGKTIYLPLVQSAVLQLIYIVKPFNHPHVVGDHDYGRLVFFGDLL